MNAISTADAKLMIAVPLSKPTTQARFVVRVGVSGHRDISPTEVNRVENEVRSVLDRISRVAQEIFDSRNEVDFKVYSDEPHVLRMISPLAEGADRIVANQALQAAFQLQAPLPFSKTEYTKDFESTDDHPEDTTKDFEGFLGKTQDQILELDGARAHEKEAYEAVGRLVLRQCDVLLAIWDPEREEKTGGTRQIVREALGLEIPIAWISAKGRREPCLLVSVEPLQTDTLEMLDQRLRKLFIFGIETDQSATEEEISDEDRARLKKEHERRQREVTAAGRFSDEKPPERDFGLLYRWFRDAWCWNPCKKKPERPQVEPTWRPLFDGNPEFREQIDKNYVWADGLAKHYGGLYRSSFIATYCMGALAVLIAFLGFYLEASNWHFAFFVLELLLIAAIFLITGAGRRGCWHQRWMDYRLLAESLRQVQFLAPLGRITISFKVPAHLQPSDPRNSWFNWYFRALARDGGMIPASFNSNYLKLCRQALSEALQGQVQYHRDNHETLEILSKRLHWVAQLSFAVAAFCCILHVQHWGHGLMSLAINLGTIVLPAFGAALGAISNHGEFERLALRSEALADRLASLQKELNHLESDSSRELGRIAEIFSEVMFGELLDWRFAFLEKNLELPA